MLKLDALRLLFSQGFVTTGLGLYYVATATTTLHTVTDTGYWDGNTRTEAISSIGPREAILILVGIGLMLPYLFRLIAESGTDKVADKRRQELILGKGPSTP